MKTLICILAIASGCSKTICKKGNEAATDDFRKGNYFLHSAEVLPAQNTYFHVLEKKYKIHWRFTDSLDFYKCYDATMIKFVNEKYEVDVLSKSRAIADSLERTPNWNEFANYPGGLGKAALHIHKNLKTIDIDKEEPFNTKIYLQITIDTLGNVINPKIMKGGINKSIDNQILKIVLDMNGWLPAYEFGKPVQSNIIIPLQLDFRE